MSIRTIRSVHPKYLLSSPMTIAELHDLCLSFPAVTEDIKWGEHLCFNIGGKMFMVTSPDNVPVTASFKTSAEDFQLLSDKVGFRPAPYMARNQWIYLDDISLLSLKQWHYYARRSYDLIASKLPMRTQKQLGLIASTSKPASVKSAKKKTSKKKKGG
jgi:predicted DNA-binding protein (MmcQ/YjbR family)